MDRKCLLFVMTHKSVSIVSCGFTVVDMHHQLTPSVALCLVKFVNVAYLRFKSPSVDSLKGI